MAMVERKCLLFEAGEYADKGLTVTEADLREIAANSPASIPVKVEHLSESPFDGALGEVVGLQVSGGKLWGSLRQSGAAWEFLKGSGARALSVALDIARKALVEVSFVTHPRVANAQVFSDGRLVSVELDWENEEGKMSSVKQFAEGLIQHIRGAVGGESGAIQEERDSLARERAALSRESAERKLEQFRREGKIRPTEKAVGIARALLASGDGAVVTFGEEKTDLPSLFAEFVEANGPVVPMGEMIPANAPGGATQRLICLAEERARKEGIAYHAAFAQEASRNPELARESRAMDE
ncbi:MAG: hypothetical protein ABJA67_14130 [Chthonomonadales bacterium]